MTNRPCHNDTRAVAPMRHIITVEHATPEVLRSRRCVARALRRLATKHAVIYGDAGHRKDRARGLEQVAESHLPVPADPQRRYLTVQHPLPHLSRVIPARVTASIGPTRRSTSGTLGSTPGGGPVASDWGRG